MISIIVPAYKVELFLEQCIESILAQTCQDIEVLLVDDGSPDQCGVICDSWATRDQRIRVIHQDNAGVAAARNAALNLAKGEYVGFVDPDDWIAPGMYGKMLECIEKYNADIVVCGYTYCSEAGETDEMRPYVRRPEEYAAGHIPGAICIPNESIGDAMPEELPIVEMNLNRPFGFLITGAEELPLFIGAVNAAA